MTAVEYERGRIALFRVRRVIGARETVKPRVLRDRGPRARDSVIRRSSFVRKSFGERRTGLTTRRRILAVDSEDSRSITFFKKKNLILGGSRPRRDLLAYSPLDQ